MPAPGRFNQARNTKATMATTETTRTSLPRTSIPAFAVCRVGVATDALNDASVGLSVLNADDSSTLSAMLLPHLRVLWDGEFAVPVVM